MMHLEEVDCDCGWSGEVEVDLQVIDKVVFRAIDFTCPECGTEISYRSNYELGEHYDN